MRMTSALHCVRTLAAGLVLVGLAGAVALAQGVTPTTGLPVAGTTYGFRLDVVSVVLLLLIGSLGWLVMTYARTNLRGQPRLVRFELLACAALLSLAAMVSGASLPVIAAGWTLSGLAVAGLVSHPGTAGARAAARRMRRTLLVGDLALWAAVGIAAVSWPSLDRADLAGLPGSAGTTAVALLLVVAAVVRSGLAPAHRWLADTAEAPSPVSALLHAGVVNGAGILALLLWPVLRAAPAALLLLLVAGLASVAVGALAARVRPDVKGRLACSTTSQMGYMSVQLALGLPAAALLHLVGHGAYKSWLFLRAGDAVARTRGSWLATNLTPGHTPGHAAAPRRSVVTTVGAVAVLTALAAPAAYVLLHTTGPAGLVPLALALLVAGLAGWEAGLLARVDTLPRRVATLAAGGAAAAYVWLLVGWEHLLTGLGAATAVWSTGTAALLVAIVVATALATAAAAGRLHLTTVSSLATLLTRTTVRPLGRRRSAAWPAAETVSELPTEHVGTAVAAAGLLVGPAWPLRESVAANPLADLEMLPVEDALALASRTYGTPLRLTLHAHHRNLSGGTLSRSHLARALREAAHQSPEDTLVTASVTEFLATSATLAALEEDHTPASSLTGRAPRLCELAATDGLTRLVDDHIGLWTARAWAHAQDDATGPWQLWRAAAAHPSYDRATGVRGISAQVRTLPEEPEQALVALLARAGVPASDVVRQLTAHLVAAPGWAAHARWRARRQGDHGPVVELLALRVALDVLLTGAATDGAPVPAAPVPPAPQESTTEVALVERCAGIWQRALELAAHDALVQQLAERSAPAQPSATGKARPLSDSLWCIDVRSERVRRHLEHQGAHRTHGYAGFFGAVVRFLDADANSYDQCPALVRSGTTVREEGGQLGLRRTLHRTMTAPARSPLGALVVAEGAGSLAGLLALAGSTVPARLRRRTGAWTGLRPHQRSAPLRLASAAELAERVGLAEGALRAVGLLDDFAPVLLVVGHGSTVTNNAHASGYDCGACGGNDGTVNAHLLADALNDPEVRRTLAERGIVLPDDTVAVAGVHDTTLDVVRLAAPDATGLPATTAAALAEIEEHLAVAGRRTATERVATLPGRSPRRSATAEVAHRAADWSQPTPEWGLAGNAALVVGPRSLTQDLDLGGRVFLHSYEREQDTDHQILTTILTAPVVVTQWISASYRFATVAPELFGAGDKTTHNVIGDVGVISGASGDLRIGLPWQSLHERMPAPGPHAESPALHDPVRHLVVLAADRTATARIVTEHQVLHQLVGNGWIDLVVVDTEGAHRLDRHLAWQPWNILAASGVARASHPRSSAAAH